MRSVAGSVSVVLSVAFVGCAEEPPNRGTADAGDFEFTTLLEKGLVQDAGTQALLGSSTLPNATSFLNQNLKLPGTIPIKFVRCGQANAFWDSENASIRLCHELGSFLLPQVTAYLAGAIQGQYSSQAELDAGALTTTLSGLKFILYHEVGHALVELFQLPITGREEDVADQFAVWMLLRDERPGRGSLYGLSSGEQSALAGAVAFAAYDHAANRTDRKLLDWAESHSFNLVRGFNILCWTFGSGSDRLAWLVEPSDQPGRLYLPPSRAAGCNYEWERIDYAFSTLLLDHLMAPSEASAPRAGGFIH